VADLDFDLTVARAEGATRLTLRGELDLGTAAQLEQALADADSKVLLDLRALTFMDSTGVRVLLEAAEEGGPDLRMLLPASGDARVTIDQSGIEQLLPVVEEDEEARP
jgi:anti-sigma B factor antagonist